MKAGPEYGVHPQIMAGQIRQMRRKRRAVRDLYNRNIHLFNEFQVDRRITCDLFFACQKIDRNRRTVLGKVSRNDKTISAIVALPCHDTHPPCPEVRDFSEKHPDHRSSGIFHQHETTNAKGFDCQLVHFAHLFSRYNKHLCSSQVKRMRSFV